MVKKKTLHVLLATRYQHEHSFSTIFLKLGSKWRRDRRQQNNRNRRGRLLRYKPSFHHYLKRTTIKCGELLSLFVRFCRHWVRNTCVVQLGWWLFNFKSYWEWNSIFHRRKRWVQSSFPYVKAMFSLSQILLFSILTSHEIVSSVPSLSEWLNASNWAILIERLDSYFRVLRQF